MQVGGASRPPAPYYSLMGGPDVGSSLQESDAGEERNPAAGTQGAKLR